MRYTCPRHLVVVIAVALSVPVRAQDAAGQGRALALVGGAWEYDLSGTGTTGFGAVRLELPQAPFLVIEPGVTYARYSPQFGGHVNYLIPELQAQLQIPGRISPFLGAGAGPSFAWGGGATSADLSLTAGVGTRVHFTEQWSARAEFRARSIHPFHNTIVEWTLGVARRF
jgi:opacity protein-like surface antigen